jgi:nucleoside-diphosphate-sugar epimerase
MRVLLAGATGAIGRPLLGALLAAGHEVHGLSRDEQRARTLDAAGAHGIVADVLDPDAVQRAAEQARPELVVQQLTSLPRKLTRRGMREGAQRTGRLREEGTRNLLQAAPGVRIIAQATAFPHRPEGGWVKTEDDPLHTDFAPVAAMARMEELVTGAGGTVLRYGYLYGPGTWYARDGDYGRMARRRMLGIVGKGDATSSFLHVDDAVAATLAAVEQDAPGVFHVTDDDPASQREWLPAFCAAVGAPAPRRMPAGLMRVLAGREGAFYLTQVRGADNARFKQTFGWQPAVASWREGFATL